MSFRCGIVGLPNVGKSTLFNALIKTTTAEVANYPFCTIEPNIGEVFVPDLRIKKIAELANSQKVIPTRIQFVDIAGLVRGASKGEGLGNQFLANIREVDAIIHVLRCFENSDIAHVEGRINPISDAQTVETELMLSDLKNLDRRITLRKRSCLKNEVSSGVLAIMQQALLSLHKGEPVRFLRETLATEERRILDSFNLLTSKPVLYICNVAENDAGRGNTYSEAISAMASKQKAQTVIISAAIEAEIAQLLDEEVKEYIKTLGLQEPGFNRMIFAGYRLLNLITYFTCGPKETRAWTIKNGTTASKAAAIIHSDLERGFIRAKTISYEDYIAYKGENGAKLAGKIRDEGKDYVVRDGDIMLFRHNT